MYRAFETIAQRDKDAGFTLLEAVLVKQSELVDGKQPAKAVIDQDGAKCQNTEL